MQQPETAAGGVLVKLTEEFPSGYLDTLSVKNGDEPEAFFARTNPNGSYEFYNLKKESNYRVIAIKPGYDFGPAKGVVAIKGDETFEFKGAPHRIRVLDRTEFRQIKNDKFLPFGHRMILKRNISKPWPCSCCRSGSFTLYCG